MRVARDPSIHLYCPIASTEFLLQCVVLYIELVPEIVIDLGVDQVLFNSQDKDFGTFHEKDTSPSTIAIICHPGNPTYPDKWILRAKGSMQNAAYPGQHAVNVPKSKPLELRYRLVLQSDAHHPKRISRLSKQF